MKHKFKKCIIVLAVMSAVTQAFAAPVNSNLIDSSGTSTVSKYGAIAIGPYNTVDSVDSGAIGTENSISGVGKGYILGNANSIYGTLTDGYAMMFGIGLSNNGYNNCVAFGSALTSSGCTANSQFNVGGLTVSNIGNAVQDSDAVNLGQVKGYLAPINSSVTNLQSTQAVHTTQINELQLKTNLTDSNLSSLQNQFTSYVSSVVTAPVTPPTAPTDLSGVQSQIDVHTGKIAGVQAELDVHGTQIATVQAQTNQNSSDIVVLKDTSANHTQQINSLTDNQNKMIDFENALAGQTNNNTKSIGQLNSRVDILEKRMDGMEGKIQSYAYSAAAMSMASNINFNPFLDRQFGVGMATVGGKSAIAIGVAVRQAASTISLKVSRASSMPTGVAASAAWGF